MQPEPLISVIIPAYNAQDCIGSCLTSLLQSTYHNLQIVVVDDGSTDDTQARISVFAQRDARITILSQANSGVSAARNNGLAHAEGEYVAFVDADDYVDPALLERLLACMTGETDVAGCGLTSVDLQGNTVYTNTPALAALPSRVTPVQLAHAYFRYMDANAVNSPCGKLYRRSLLENCRFSTTLKIGEDASFNLSVFIKAREMVWIPDGLYFYVQSDNQSTRKIIPGYCDMMIEHFTDIHTFIDRFGGYEQSEVDAGMGRYWLNTMLGDLVQSHLPRRDIAEHLRRYRQCPFFPYIYVAGAAPSFPHRVLRWLIKTNQAFGLYLISGIYQMIKRRKGR